MPQSRHGHAARIRPMPVGTAFHPRTLPLCESLNYREWAGYYAVSAYEAHHEHEYNAIRNAAALIDVSPLFKYLVTGPDATRLVDRIITRDATKVGRRPGDLHAVVRRARQGHRRRDGDAAATSRSGAGRRPIRACAGSGRTRRASTSRSRTSASRWRRSRCRGRRRRALLRAGGRRRHRRAEVLPRDPRRDRRRARSRSRAPATPAISATRSGCRADRALRGLGRAHGARHARSTSARPACSRSTWRASKPGCCSSTSISTAAKKCLIDAQRYTPYEMGLGRLVQRRQGPVRRPRRRCAGEARAGPKRQIVGLEIDWTRGRGALLAASGCRRRCRRPPRASPVPGVPRRTPGRQGHVHHVVAGAEEAASRWRRSTRHTSRRHARSRSR